MNKPLATHGNTMSEYFFFSDRASDDADVREKPVVDQMVFHRLHAIAHTSK